MVLEKVFVTGGSGTIGKKIVEILAKENYQVKILSRKKYKNKKNIKYILGDLSNKDLLKKELKECSFLIHLAACIGGDKSDEEFFKTNVLGTKNVLESAPKDIKKIVCVSTASIFADCGNKIRTENWKKKINSKNPYITTKLEAYNLSKKYKKDLPIVTIFPSAVIDIHKKANPAKGIIGFLWNLSGKIPGGLVSKIGSSQRIINYVLVEDVAKGIVLAMQKGINGQDYLLTGENLKIKDFIKKMEKIYHQKSLPLRIPIFMIKLLTIIPINWPKLVYDIAQNGMANVWFSNKKAVQELGYKVKTNLDF
jgi:nucleoside-diphosphate-sugar epimerase